MRRLGGVLLCCLLLGACVAEDSDDFALAVCAEDSMTAAQVQALETAIDAWHGDSDTTAIVIPADRYDMPSVLMHELGHALGLLHTTDPLSVMFVVARPGEVRQIPMPADLDQLDDDGPLFWLGDARDTCDVRVEFAWPDTNPVGKIGYFAEGRLWLNPAFPWFP